VIKRNISYCNRVFITFFLILVSISIIGCSIYNSQQTSVIEKETPDNTKKKIALVMRTLTNPFFIDMEKGARKAEHELNIDLIIKTGSQETSNEHQISIVEDLIKSKVDAIVISPGSSTDIIPILKKAQDNNIKIVNIDNKLDEEASKKIGLKDVPFISVNNEEGAYLSAKYISDKIKNPTKAVILEGIIEANNSESRKNGALRAFKENPNIQIVAVKSASWKIDVAKDVTAKLYEQYPDIGAIFCANDMMALGAIEYLEIANKKNVLIAGFDDLNETEQAIRNGKMQVTINQQANIQGYMGAKYAIEMINGKTEPLETMIDIVLVDSNNLRN
jgi:ribose transport system substrate-binding protein